MNEFRVEEWTERECELLNEMKARCLNGGKYKDEKAKEKFEMICHLEDYCVQYYQLLDYINQLEKGIHIEVGDYINGDKIVNITKDMFIKGQIDMFTDNVKITDFGDREVIAYRVRKGSENNE